MIGENLVDIIERYQMVLRNIANRAGAPTMHYAPDFERKEQRESLNWIAEQAKRALTS